MRLPDARIIRVEARGLSPVVERVQRYLELWGHDQAPFTVDVFYDELLFVLRFSDDANDVTVANLTGWLSESDGIGEVVQGTFQIDGAMVHAQPDRDFELGDTLLAVAVDGATPWRWVDLPSFASRPAAVDAGFVVEDARPRGDRLARLKWTRPAREAAEEPRGVVTRARAQEGA